MGERGDDVIGITAAQLFGTPDEAFIIKKNKKTEEKKSDGGDENDDGDGKKGEKKRKQGLCMGGDRFCDPS